MKKDLFRMGWWAAIALASLIAIAYISPHQISVVLVKINLLSLGAFTGYWVDRMAFPYARPHQMLGSSDYAEIRRAIIIAAAIIGMALAL